MAIVIRIIQRYFTEDDIFDGEIDYFRENVEDYTADDVDEAAAWIRIEGLTFESTGNEWAADPDGSFILDYRTGVRIESTAHIIESTDEERRRIIEIVG